MPARTISEVIARLTQIIEESMDGRSRLGYFAALYNRVTMRVRDEMERGLFDDADRMGRLDVEFANRYFDAYDQYRRGELAPRAWLQAFEAARRDDLGVLQHLLLGMNTHIDLDLGVAAARVSPGGDYAALQGDFRKINEILYSLVPLEEDENARIAPVLGILEAAAGGLEQTMARVTMKLARGDAWEFGATLAPLALPDQVHPIALRDLEVTAAGELLLAKPAAMLLRLGESEDTRRNIELLASGEFGKRPSPPR